MPIPITYSNSNTLRFCDFDVYGHLSASRYLDYVINSRFDFCLEKFGKSIKHFSDAGIGFFLFNYEIRFQKEIAFGTSGATITSHVSSNIEEKFLRVPFEIQNLEKSTNFAQGILTFGIIDLAKKTLVTLPQEFYEIFWEI